MVEMNKTTILVRGAGELGSAIAVKLFRSGFRVILTEIEAPLAIRRAVTFSDAIFDEVTEVENIEAKLCETDDFENILKSDSIPLLVDDNQFFSNIEPDFLVDARMLKKEIEKYSIGSGLVIGLGPGFIPGKNCWAAIETNRGEHLGDALFNKPPEANTGIPGVLGGETMKRVIYSHTDGKLNWYVNFGDEVQSGDVLGKINKDYKIISPLTGIVRGLISPHINITEGLKIADVDPRGSRIDYRKISRKAQTVAKGVMDAIRNQTVSRGLNG